MLTSKNEEESVSLLKNKNKTENLVLSPKNVNDDVNNKKNNIIADFEFWVAPDPELEIVTGHCIHLWLRGFTNNNNNFINKSQNGDNYDIMNIDYTNNNTKNKNNNMSNVVVLNPNNENPKQNVVNGIVNTLQDEEFSRIKSIHRHSLCCSSLLILTVLSLTFFYHTYYYIGFVMLIIWFLYLIFQTRYFHKKYNEYYNKKFSSLSSLCSELNQYYNYNNKCFYCLFPVPPEKFSVLHKTKRYQKQARIRVAATTAGLSATIKNTNTADINTHGDDIIDNI